MKEYIDSERRIGLSVLYNILSRYAGEKFEKEISRETLVKLFHKPPYRRVYKRIKGKRRPLDVPSKKLKTLLKAILHHILYDFYDFSISKSAHGGIIGRSIVTNAREHIGAKSFFYLDFKDHFPSITTEAIIICLKRLFKQTRRLNLFRDCGLISWRHSKALAKVIAHLATVRNSLPQGAPTSPFLQNLILYDLDESMRRLARRFDLSYTRFIDDMVVSGKYPRISKEARVKIINTIKEQVGDMLRLNRKKIHYKTGRGKAPKITGITIISTEDGGFKLSLPQKKIERFRAAVYQASLKPVLTKEEKARIWGIIGLIAMVPGRIPPRLTKPFKRFLEVHYPEAYPENFDRYDNPNQS